MAGSRRYEIKAIWEEPEIPTYIMDSHYLVHITRAKNKKLVMDELFEKVETIKGEIEKNGIKIEETYFGKTFVEKGDEFDYKNPKTWKDNGIINRFASHKTLKGTIAQRNMIILTTAITDDNVPNDIEESYKKLKLDDSKSSDSKLAKQPSTTPPPKGPSSRLHQDSSLKKPTQQKSTTPERGIVSPHQTPTPKKSTNATQKNVTNTTPTKEPRSQGDIVSPQITPPPKEKTNATCPAEYCALQIERELYSQTGKQRDAEGRTGEHDGYVVYMRITHSEREEVCVKNINENIGDYKVCMSMKITKKRMTSKEDDQLQEVTERLEDFSFTEGSGAQRKVSQKDTPKIFMGAYKPKKPSEKLEEVKVTAGRLLEQMNETIKAFDDAYISMTIKLAELKKKIEQLQS